MPGAELRLGVLRDGADVQLHGLVYVVHDPVGHGPFRPAGCVASALFREDVYERAGLPAGGRLRPRAATAATATACTAAPTPRPASELRGRVGRLGRVLCQRVVRLRRHRAADALLHSAHRSGGGKFTSNRAFLLTVAILGYLLTDGLLAYVSRPARPA